MRCANAEAHQLDWLEESRNETDMEGESSFYGGGYGGGSGGYGGGYQQEAAYGGVHRHTSTRTQCLIRRMLAERRLRHELGQH